jgi:hypothetical protein
MPNSTLFFKIFNSPNVIDILAGFTVGSSTIKIFIVMRKTAGVFLPYKKGVTHG